MREHRSDKVRWTRALLWSALVVAGAVGIGLAFSALQSHTTSSSTSGTGVRSSASTSSDGVDPQRPDLDLPIASLIWSQYNQAKDTKDAGLFEKVTCESFLQADLKQRGLTSVEQLLGAYERAKRYVPVQFIEKVTPISAQGHEPTGQLVVDATVTDNRFVPPTTQRRPITFSMRYEDSSWKLCPGIDPV